MPDPPDRLDSEFEIPEGTIQFWFNTDDAGRDRTMFSKDRNGTGAGQLNIGIDSRDLVVQLQSSSKTFTINTNGTQFNDLVKSDTWYQPSFSFGPAGMKLYLDGALVGSNTIHRRPGRQQRSHRHRRQQFDQHRFFGQPRQAEDHAAVRQQGRRGGGVRHGVVPAQIQQSRQRGSLGVPRTEDIGTVDGTDTLISIENIGINPGASGQSAQSPVVPTVQTPAAPPTLSLSALPAASTISAPAAQPNTLQSAAKQTATIDWTMQDTTKESKDNDKSDDQQDQEDPRYDGLGQRLRHQPWTEHWGPQSQQQVEGDLGCRQRSSEEDDAPVRQAGFCVERGARTAYSNWSREDLWQKQAKQASRWHPRSRTKCA